LFSAEEWREMKNLLDFLLAKVSNFTEKTFMYLFAVQ
jgi:hypothetical protein